MLNIFIIVHTVVAVSAYPSLMTKIPNGEAVTSPCDNSKWGGVGHRNQGGAGKLNPFGETFEESHEEWTSAVCRADSDGDGRSNGEELGDPDCRWRPGQTPSRTSGITHPGICDPMTSAECKKRNSWVSCDNAAKGEFCPILKTARAGVLEFRMNTGRNTMAIPAEETNYYCQRFAVPDDQEYQFIAFEPLIDNADYYHHAVIYACESKMDIEMMDLKYSSPYKCGMDGIDGPDCGRIIMIWSSGVQGWCLNPEAGTPFGRDYYKNIWMEVHWNNPKKMAGIIDRSGIRAHYIRKSRPYSMGQLIMDQRHLVIPPGSTQTTFTSTLDAKCSEAMFKAENVEYKIDSVFPHMHLLGSGSSLVLTRKDGKNEKLLGGHYDYTSPGMKTFEENGGVTIRPGDSLQFSCTFDSSKQSNYTFWGYDTQAEMCMAFLTYYPAIETEWAGEQLTSYIASVGSYNDCSMYTWDRAPNGCGRDEFSKSSSTVRKLAEVCASDDGNIHPRQCNSECLEFMVKTDLLGEPCLRSPLLHWTVTYTYEVMGEYLYTPKGMTVGPMIELCIEVANNQVVMNAFNTGKSIVSSGCQPGGRVGKSSKGASGNFSYALVIFGALFGSSS